MSFESIPGKGVADQRPLLSTGITASSSASEVVDFLRTSFQRMDFSLGQKILTDRENALKAEIESLRKANEVREFQNCKMGVELQRAKNENIDLAENNARLKREMEELKAEKMEVEERLKASEERYVLLDKRVSRMEENLGAYVGERVPDVSNIADKLDDVLEPENDGLSFGTQNATIVGGSSSPEKEVSYVVLSDDEEENQEMPLDNDDFLGKSEMGLGPKKNEVKRESLRRKRIIGIDDDDDDGGRSSFCVQKRKLVHETEVIPVFDSPKNHGDAGMSAYESMARVKCEPIVSPMAGKSTASSDLNLKPQKVGSGPWLDQNEMILAFVNDRELCMSAVCALYRKLISAPLSLKPMDRGFDSSDQLGVELAKYLIDGHPENKLNRAMSETSKVAAEESTRLALKYSGQLFRIYSSGEDPLFCHNSTSSRR
ncbi:PREDICTED: uncharacterized protein LOC109165874 [Ipomoea nil]|uniref:uncharacterized protein LOC109165874 n=1 Tax=Ipomoea nil TaxID=35883 RepID=UPI0009010D16|nr:PREDICTED: uncharacterized protein LOC109165874 [Ipomoea nil]